MNPSDGAGVLRSYQDLLDHLVASGLMIQADTVEQTVQIATKKGALEGVVFIRWQQRQGTVQVLHTMPFEVPIERMSSMALALLHVNHGLVIPGFGLNMASRFSYFRITLIRNERGEITTTRLQQAFNVAVRTAARHFIPLRDVALHEADPLGVLDVANAMDAVDLLN